MYGMYRGRLEENPGKMQYRHKGRFRSKDRARALQQRLASQGLKAKVVTFTDGFSVYVMAKHDFWGRNFTTDWAR